MARAEPHGSLILIVHDVEEVRDGIASLLRTDGYRVASARTDEDGVESARLVQPDLILVSPRQSAVHVIGSTERMRERAGLSEAVPIVIFSVETLAEGAEAAVAGNVHLTRPDNFDQLRALIGRLLRSSRPTATDGAT